MDWNFLNTLHILTMPQSNLLTPNKKLLDILTYCDFYFSAFGDALMTGWSKLSCSRDSQIYIFQLPWNQQTSSASIVQKKKYFIFWQANIDRNNFWLWCHCNLNATNMTLLIELQYPIFSSNQLQKAWYSRLLDSCMLQRWDSVVITIVKKKNICLHCNRKQTCSD